VTRPRVKPVIPRERANRDVDEAIAYHIGERAEQAALGFIDSLERADALIARRPAAGSARYALELGLPGLRFWPLGRYPYLVFYVERDDRIDVWRVLHGQRDIPALMREPGEP
jgi:toxin ParE1/3/4